ncbi:MAG TPA: hypothetical protein PLI90_13395, partial [Rhodocyclaceae bacterium]|nr:hypothetical protein [Rhodocyclaceae bacterium]
KLCEACHRYESHVLIFCRWDQAGAMAPAFLVDAPGMALMWAVGMAPRKIPAHLARMRTQMQFAIIEKRWGRQCLAKTLYRPIPTERPYRNGINWPRGHVIDSSTDICKPAKNATIGTISLPRI